MSKGIAPELFIFVLALLVLTVTQIYTQLHSDVAVLKRGLSETSVVEGTNVMEYLKKSLQQALKYSYYQASYEAAKTGGTFQSSSTWRKYDDISGYPSKFLDKLSVRTLEIFKQYVSALSETDIILGDYSKIDIEKKGNGESLSAFSEKEMEIAKTSLFRLINNANVYVAIPTKTLTLFELAKNKFVDTDNLKIAIELAEKSIPNKCRQVTFTACENEQPSCESQLANVCGEIDDEFKSSINSKINSLQKTENNIEQDVIAEEILTKHSTNSGISIGQQDSSCGCKMPRTEQKKVACFDEELAQDPNKVCTTSVEVCDEYYKKATVTCSYSYIGTAKARVEVTDKEAGYPVYDEDAAIRNIKLIFNVISSNDYSQKLIQ